jgi:hypothetical protein
METIIRRTSSPSRSVYEPQSLVFYVVRVMFFSYPFRAIGAVAQALQIAAADTNSSNGAIDVKNIHSSPAAVALAKAELEVGQCFSKFGVRLAFSVHVF